MLPLHTLLLSYVVTSFVATEYGVNDTWSIYLGLFGTVEEEGLLWQMNVHYTQ